MIRMGCLLQAHFSCFWSIGRSAHRCIKALSEEYPIWVFALKASLTALDYPLLRMYACSPHWQVGHLLKKSGRCVQDVFSLCSFGKVTLRIRQWHGIPRVQHCVSVTIRRSSVSRHLQVSSSQAHVASADAVNLSSVCLPGNQRPTC